MRAVEYTVLREHGAYGIEELQDRVNELIGLGWQPLGGVTTGNDGGTISYLQAMVRGNAVEITGEIAAEDG